MATGVRVMLFIWGVAETSTAFMPLVPCPYLPACSTASSSLSARGSDRSRAARAMLMAEGGGGDRHMKGEPDDAEARSDRMLKMSLMLARIGKRTAKVGGV